MIVSYDAEKASVVSMGIGSLRKGRLGARPRSLCVLQFGSVDEKNPQ